MYGFVIGEKPKNCTSCSLFPHGKPARSEGYYCPAKDDFIDCEASSEVDKECPLQEVLLKKDVKPRSLEWKFNYRTASYIAEASSGIFYEIMMTKGYIYSLYHEKIINHKEKNEDIDQLISDERDFCSKHHEKMFFTGIKGNENEMGND